jgi:hypothetical protein
MMLNQEELTLLGLAIVFVLGIIGVVGMFVRWLMSPPNPKNNRFMGREFHNNED